MTPIDDMRARAQAFIDSGQLPSGDEKLLVAYDQFMPFARNILRTLLDQHDADQARIAALETALQEIVSQEIPDYGSSPDPEFYDGWRDAKETYTEIARAALRGDDHD